MKMEKGRRADKVKISPRYEAEADFVLFEGDCLQLLRSMPDRSVQLVITSPPYNLGKEYESRAKLDQYVAEQAKVIRECVRVLDDRGSLCWQVGNYVDNGEIVPLDLVLFPVFSELKLKLRNRVVWHFAHGLHASKRLSGRYEVALWFTKNGDYRFDVDPIRIPQKYPGKKYFKGPKKGQLSGNPLGKNPGDVWEIPNVKANHIEKTIHPCQFPVELIERFVLSLTKPGDTVLDPYMGVGSTAIAALVHGRRAIGAEIMPEYAKVARDRVRAAEDGKLQIRPMGRPVFDPDAPDEYVPPQTVRIGPTRKWFEVQSES